MSSGIEFAVSNLKVENIIVMGHRQCGGIRALMTSQTSETEMPGRFVGPWMNIARGAAVSAELELGKTAEFDSLCRECEMKSIVASLVNLKSFPFVQDAIDTRGMTLIGAYVDLERGEMFQYDEEQYAFRQIPL